MDRRCEVVVELAPTLLQVHHRRRLVHPVHPLPSEDFQVLQSFLVDELLEVEVEVLVHLR